MSPTLPTWLWILLGTLRLLERNRWTFTRSPRVAYSIREEAAAPLGGPLLTGGTSRAFPVPSSSCSIPATAQAYSMNATVVPPTPLGFLTLWGSGTMPLASTLNSLDGSIVANAALVPAGAERRCHSLHDGPQSTDSRYQRLFQIATSFWGRTLSQIRQAESETPAPPRPRVPIGPLLKLIAGSDTIMTSNGEPGGTGECLPP